MRFVDTCFLVCCSFCDGAVGFIKGFSIVVERGVLVQVELLNVHMVSPIKRPLFWVSLGGSMSLGCLSQRLA